MIPSLTITTMSSSSNQPIDTTGSHDIVHGSYDTNDNKAHDIDGSHDSSDAVTTETDDDTIVEQRAHLKQCDVVSGSHDTEDDSSTAEESSHDPDRSVILNKIYQKYVRDVTRTQKTRRPRKKKVYYKLCCIIILFQYFVS